MAASEQRFRELPLVPPFGGHLWYTVRRGSSKQEYEHQVWFQDGRFTLDGKRWESQDDPEHLSFVEKVKNHKLPDEFEGDGYHHIMVEYLEDDEVWGGGFDDDEDDECESDNCANLTPQELKGLMC